MCRQRPVSSMISVSAATVVLMMCSLAWGQNLPSGLAATFAHVDATLVGQVPPKLLIPLRPEEAARLLRAEVNHIFQATRQVILSSADVRQRYRDLQAERTRLLGMDKNDPAYASAARDNNALWAGLSQHINRYVFDRRNALRRARDNPSHPSLKGADAELAWMQKWGHLPEWDMLMEAWMLSREADEEATAVLTLSIPPALLIPEVQPPQPPETLPAQENPVGTWRMPYWSIILEPGGSLRLSDNEGKIRQLGPGTWTLTGRTIELKFNNTWTDVGRAWYESTIHGELTGDTISGTDSWITHHASGGTSSRSQRVVLTRVKN